MEPVLGNVQSNKSLESLFKDDDWDREERDDEGRKREQGAGGVKPPNEEDETIDFYKELISDFVDDKNAEEAGVKPPTKKHTFKPSDKAEEGMIGAGQRGLGYGNDGYTNVQGSGQSHTISEIPPEMEVIVHDVKDIKEV